jgi:hypothetical protein
LPSLTASSFVAYSTKFFGDIFAADSHPALWNTFEFFEAMNAALVVAVFSFAGS